MTARGDEQLSMYPLQIKCPGGCTIHTLTRSTIRSITVDLSDFPTDSPLGAHSGGSHPLDYIRTMLLIPARTSVQQTHPVKTRECMIPTDKLAQGGDQECFRNGRAHATLSKYTRHVETNNVER